MDHLTTQVDQSDQRGEPRAAGLLRGWSVRRRWTLFVLLPAILLCCGGLAAVPVLHLTAAAGRGAPTPDAAADQYLMALSYGNEEGLLPLLDDDRQDDLLAQWRGYRHAMETTQPPPDKLDYGGLTVTPDGDDRARVSTDVAATWWQTGGRAGSYSSREHTWQFEVREDDGWRVTAVEAPEWCGRYVRADACGAR